MEFALSAPFPIYQFKLWRTEGEDAFLLVKNNSTLLSRLKVGNIVPMKYRGNSAIDPMEVRNTEIKRIVNEHQGRFQGHCRIELSIAAKQQAAIVQ